MKVYLRSNIHAKIYPAECGKNLAQRYTRLSLIHSCPMLHVYIIFVLFFLCCCHYCGWYCCFPIEFTLLPSFTDFLWHLNFAFGMVSVQIYICRLYAHFNFFYLFTYFFFTHNAEKNLHTIHSTRVPSALLPRSVSLSLSFSLFLFYVFKFYCCVVRQEKMWVCTEFFVRGHTIETKWSISSVYYAISWIKYRHGKSV